MSYTRLFVKPTQTLSGQEKKNPSDERLKLSFSLSGSHSPKLAPSITTDQLARSGLISVGSASLEEWDRQLQPFTPRKHRGKLDD